MHFVDYCEIIMLIRFSLGSGKYGHPQFVRILRDLGHLSISVMFFVITLKTFIHLTGL